MSKKKQNKKRRVCFPKSG